MHRSRNGHFTSDRGDNTEFVPCFIYDTSRDLASEQRTRDEPLSVNGELNLLDVSTYLRNRITAVDTLTRHEDQPAEGDSKPAAPPPVESKPVNSQSKQSASSGATSSGDPLARRQGGNVPIHVPDDP